MDTELPWTLVLQDHHGHVRHHLHRRDAGSRPTKVGGVTPLLPQLSSSKETHVVPAFRSLDFFTEFLYSPLDRKCSLPPACSKESRKRGDTVGEPSTGPFQHAKVTLLRQPIEASRKAGSCAFLSSPTVSPRFLDSSGTPESYPQFVSGEESRNSVQ